MKKLILTERNKYCSINHWLVVHKTHPMMESMSNYIRFLPKLSLFSNLVEVFSLFYDMLTTTSLTKLNPVLCHINHYTCWHFPTCCYPHQNLPKTIAFVYDISTRMNSTTRNLDRKLELASNCTMPISQRQKHLKIPK